MKKIVLLFALAGTTAAAQIANTNQALLDLHPSYAGNSGGLRGQSTLGVQSWGTRFLRYNAYGAVDHFANKLNAGFGLSFYQSYFLSFQKSRSVAFTYSQRLDFCKNVRIIPSIQMSYSQQFIDEDWFVGFGNQKKAGNYVWTTNSREYINARSSLSLTGGLLINIKKNFYFGLSVSDPDAFSSGSSRVIMGRRWDVHAAYTIHLSDKNMIQVLGRYAEGLSSSEGPQLCANALISGHMLLSAGVDTDGAMYASAGYQSQVFRLVGSYGSYRYRLAGMYGNWNLGLSITPGKKDYLIQRRNFEEM